MLAAASLASRAATIGHFATSLGDFELEFYDEDKPITVSNFIKYVQSGRFEKQFIQRWEPNFVIQAGGYYAGARTNAAADPDFRTIKTFGPIQNEYSAGRPFSNTYGTIAMARQGGVVNSASSQWFLNLTNNAFLDSVDEGFTVFGRVTKGTNVLNYFIQGPSTNAVVKRGRVAAYRNDYGEVISLDTLPVLTHPTNIASFSQLFTNIIYIDIALRREMELKIARAPEGRTLSWKSVAGITNIVEFSPPFASAGTGAWVPVTNVVGTGATMQALDPASAAARIYRVRLEY